MFCTLMGPKLADFPSFGQYGAEISRRKIEDINLVSHIETQSYYRVLERLSST